MTPTDKGREAAFPSVAKEYLSDEVGGNWCEVRMGGLTKREWLAGLAMQGLLSGCIAHNSDNSFTVPNEQMVAEVALKHVDALLKELAKPPAREGEANE